MKTLFAPWRFVLAVSVLAVPVSAQDWGGLATISSTMGVNANRLCIGEGLRTTDIGCPTYAPTVGSDGLLTVSNVSATGGISVTGNVSANKFIGDGSGLTGVTAGSADWYDVTNIPAQVQAVSNSGAIGMAGISATNISVTTNLTASGATISSIGANAIAANSVSSTLVSATNVSATLVDATRNGTVSATYGYFGQVSASTYYGDGSNLTGINASQVSGIAADRISTSGVASGANLGMVVADQGTISFTTGGVAGTSYLDSAGRWIGPGISITTAHGVSSTNGYFSGNVGIGTAAPSSTLHVKGGVTVDAGSINFRKTDGSANITTFSVDGSDNLIVNRLAGKTYAVKRSSTFTDMLIDSSGNIGISTTTPLAKLDVNGTISASDAIQIGDTALTCGAGIPGAIKYASNALHYCNGSAWTQIASGGSAVPGGSNNSIQYNNNGTFGGDTGFTYVSGTGSVSASGAYYSGDANAYFYNNGTQPSLVFDSGDYLRYTRGSNVFDLLIAGTPVVSVNATGDADVAGRVSATLYYGGNGTTAAPSYSFSNDTNSGFYRPQSNVIGVSIGSSEVARFTGAGISTSGVVVAGTVSASLVSATNVSATNVQIGAGSLACGATIPGALRYNGGALEYCNGAAWLPLSASGSADWYALTNIPAQVQAVSDSGAIVMSGVSATNISVTTNLTASGATISSIGANAIAANSVSSTLVSATNVSATLVDATRNGTVSATYGYFGQVSASTYYGDGSNLSGVIASGVAWSGITGKPTSIVSLSTGLTGGLAANDVVYFDGTDYQTTSATTLLGLGSLAYGNDLSWYALTNIPAQVQAVSDSGAIVMSGVSATNISVTTNLTASGATISSIGANAIAANSVSSTLVSATNVSATLVDATRNGTVSATYGYFGQVSASTYYGDGSNLSGVIASGVAWSGITGKPTSIVSLSTGLTGGLAANDVVYFDGTDYQTTSATTLLGLGSLAYGNDLSWYALTNIPAQVQAVSDSGAIVMSGVSATNISVTTNLTASGATISSIGANAIAANSVSSTLVSATNVSATLVDATRNGTVSATYGYFGQVSASTYYGDGSNLSGVIASGVAWSGITGKPTSIVSLSTGLTGGLAANDVVYFDGTDYQTTSATTLLGLGSLAYGNDLSWYALTNIPAQVQAVSDSGAIVMSGVSATNISVTTNLTASGATISSIGANAIAANSVSSTLVSATNVSATLVDATRNGTVSATYGYFGQVSASTYYGDGSNLSGVIASGVAWSGITGKPTSIVSLSTGLTGGLAANDVVYFDGTDYQTTSATTLLGLGSLAYGNDLSWYALTNIPAQVQAVSDSGAIVMSGVSATNISVTTNLTASGATISSIGANAIAANSVSSTLVSATNVSATLVDATRNGTVSATYGYFSYVSGSGAGLYDIPAGAVTGLNLDRITSGTLAVVANSATSYISLSTGGTDWGYLGNAQSYLPRLAGEHVSSTNVSVTVAGFSGSTVGVLGGPGGNFIASGTTSVSTSSAGTIKFATAGSQRMVIDASGNVGIGTTSPSGTLHVHNAGANTSHLFMSNAQNGQAGTIMSNWNSMSFGANSMTSNLRIDATGRVGISDNQFNTTPSAALHVSSTLGTTAIFQGGNVGIGTTNPGAALEVAGGTATDTAGSGQILRLSTAAGTPLWGFRSSASNSYLHLDRSWSTWQTPAISIERASGNVGIGTTGPSQKLDVYGSIAQNGSTIHSSDRRLKKNIQPLAQGLAAIGALKPVTYEWRAPQDDGMRGTQYGLIAQDVQLVLPELVRKRGDVSNTLSLDYNGLIPVLINAVQELKVANDTLRETVAQQGNALDELRRQLQELRNNK
ncbi:MAG: tail fiber domain-containing protein [Pseudomonadaceae bacterium]|nr:tail fiber domain-containing protein [Pseudomonadaceae bacterium]